MKKKFVVQIVSSQNPWHSSVTYTDVPEGDKDTKEEAVTLIAKLVEKVPSYDYRIDERYVR